MPNLDEDRILRLFLGVVNATVRTNYFHRDTGGQPRPFVSFKFNPSQVPGLPEPRPMFEIWVYSPRVEGVHLRGGAWPAAACAGRIGAKISARKCWA